MAETGRNKMNSIQKKKKFKDVIAEGKVKNAIEFIQYTFVVCIQHIQQQEKTINIKSFCKLRNVQNLVSVLVQGVVLKNSKIAIKQKRNY